MTRALATLCFLSATLFPTPGFSSQFLELWHCYSPDDTARATPLLILGRGKDDLKHKGVIAVGGTSYQASFFMHDTSRRWSWSSHPTSHHTFLVAPDGTGSLYDFSYTNTSDTVTAKDTFRCFSSE